MPNGRNTPLSTSRYHCSELMCVDTLANIFLGEQAGWWQRNLQEKGNLSKDGVMATRVRQLNPPGLYPVTKLGGSRSEVY